MSFSNAFVCGREGWLSAIWMRCRIYSIPLASQASWTDSGGSTCNYQIFLFFVVVVEGAICEDPWV